MESNETAPLAEAYARNTESVPTAKNGELVCDSIHAPISVPPIVRHETTSAALDVAARNTTPFVWMETSESDGLAGRPTPLWDGDGSGTHNLPEQPQAPELR